MKIKPFKTNSVNVGKTDDQYIFCIFTFSFYSQYLRFQIIETLVISLFILEFILECDF